MVNTSVQSYATLCIHSSKLSAKDIAKAMQTESGKLQEANQPVSARPGARLAEHSTWQLSSRLKDTLEGLDEDNPIRNHIEFLVTFMEGRKESLQQIESKCEFDIWCFVSFEKSHLGFDLDHSLTARLSQFPATLIFDLYSSVDEAG